jgi:hypothetical protein
MENIHRFFLFMKGRDLSVHRPYKNIQALYIFHFAGLVPIYPSCSTYSIEALRSTDCSAVAISPPEEFYAVIPIVMADMILYRKNSSFSRLISIIAVPSFPYPFQIQLIH